MKTEYEICPNCGSHIPAGTAVCPYCQYVIYQDDNDMELPSLKASSEKPSRSSAPSHRSAHRAVYENPGYSQTRYSSRHSMDYVEEPEEEQQQTHTLSDLKFDIPLDEQPQDPEYRIPENTMDYIEMPKPKIKQEKQASPLKYILLFVVLLLVFCTAGYIGVNVLTGKGLPFLPQETATPTKQPVSTPTPTPEVTATPEPTVVPTATPEPEIADDGSIGTVEITADNIRERSSASTDSEEVGQALAGEQYTVYEEYNDGVYTWYRIGENVWVPTDGTWMTFTGR